MDVKEKSIYLRPKTIKEQFDITSSTLRTWYKETGLRTIKTPGGNILYNKEDLYKLLEIPDNVERKNIIYCRVSSEHQKDDLERQIEYMRTNAPDGILIKDIGSGVNYSKTGFKKVLKEVLHGNVNKIYISDKDRLLRFGYELFEEVCKQFNTQIVVLHSTSDPEDTERELADDLLTICNVFVARKNGQRAARNRKERKAEITEK